MQVLKEGWFIKKANAVMKTEKRLPNEYCIPHKVITRYEDDVIGKRANMNKASMTWINDDDTPRNKVARTCPHKAPGSEPASETTGYGLGSLKTYEKKKRKERNNVLLHCRSSY